MPGLTVDAEQWRERYAPKDGPTIGLDEVGLGAWAGPVVVGALCIQSNLYNFGPDLRDSKKLNAFRRNEVALDIEDALKRRTIDSTLAVGVGLRTNLVVDEIGLHPATMEAARDAVLKMWQGWMREVPVLLDGLPGNWSGMEDFFAAHFDHWYYLPKADDCCRAVGGASIVAKVIRDNIMSREMDKRFPGYEFWRNVGYGTMAHRKALNRLGPCAIHRMTYGPLKELNRASA